MIGSRWENMGSSLSVENINMIRSVAASKVNYLIKRLMNGLKFVTGYSNVWLFNLQHSNKGSKKRKKYSRRTVGGKENI